MTNIFPEKTVRFPAWVGKAAAERRARRGALVGGKTERNRMAVSLAPG